MTFEGWDEMSEELIRSLLEAMETRIIAAVKQEIDVEHVNEKRFNNNLHNTKLLLKNYSTFQEHCENAQFTAKSLIDDDLMDLLIDKSGIDDVYIKSILKTKERTAIMLNHIKRVIDYYEYLGESNCDEAHTRRSKVLKLMYIDKHKADKIAKMLDVDKRTVWRDRDKAIEEISPLLFGIDGVKMA